MTSAILRRNSSKQGLQNLIRLTAQWSVEDEEEAARERRRREREKQLRSQAEESLNGTGSCPESTGPAQQNHYDFKPSGTLELEEDEGFSDWSQKLEQRKQSSRSPQQSYEEEESSVREAEVKLEQLQLDRESPEEIREENADPGEEERLCQEEEVVGEQEEEETAKQEEKKRRRNEEEPTAEKRQKAPSSPSLEEEEEELFSEHTVGCSTKITDRTESLNRSIKKSNSIKKTQPPLPVSKIDDRLEQYTQAIETSTKAPKPVRQPSLDLPTTSMMVASTKSLWETGEVAAQSATKPLPCKDIVAGDIVSKRSLWEQKGNPKPETNVKDKETMKSYLELTLREYQRLGACAHLWEYLLQCSNSCCSDSPGKIKISWLFLDQRCCQDVPTPPGKKYKFVATGHGQYKKVLIDDAAEQ